MINQVIIPILVLLANVISTVVLVSFVLSLLVAFNVVSMSNRFVASLLQALDAILTPILRPVRRIMPPTGGIDFSPIVLLVGIKIALIILQYLGNQFE